MLEVQGIDPERFAIEWVSSAEGPRFAELVNKFIGRIKGITVEPAVLGARRTVCIANDFVYEISKHKMNLLDVQENRRSDLLFGDVYANMDDVAEATAAMLPWERPR